MSEVGDTETAERVSVLTHSARDSPFTNSPSNGLGSRPPSQMTGIDSPQSPQLPSGKGTPHPPEKASPTPIAKPTPTPPPPPSTGKSTPSVPQSGGYSGSTSPYTPSGDRPPTAPAMEVSSGIRPPTVTPSEGKGSLRESLRAATPEGSQVQKRSRQNSEASLASVASSFKPPPSEAISDSVTAFDAAAKAQAAVYAALVRTLGSQEARVVVDEMNKASSSPKYSPKYSPKQNTDNWDSPSSLHRHGDRYSSGYLKRDSREADRHSLSSISSAGEPRLPNMNQLRVSLPREDVSRAKTDMWEVDTSERSMVRVSVAPDGASGSPSFNLNNITISDNGTSRIKVQTSNDLTEIRVNSRQTYPYSSSLGIRSLSPHRTFSPSRALSPTRDPATRALLHSASYTSSRALSPSNRVTSPSRSNLRGPVVSVTTSPGRFEIQHRSTSPYSRAGDTAAALLASPRVAQRSFSPTRISTSGLQSFDIEISERAVSPTRYSSSDWNRSFS